MVGGDGALSLRGRDRGKDWPQRLAGDRVSRTEIDGRLIAGLRLHRGESQRVPQQGTGVAGGKLCGGAAPIQLGDHCVIECGQSAPLPFDTAQQLQELIVVEAGQVESGQGIKGVRQSRERRRCIEHVYESSENLLILQGRSVIRQH